MKRYTIEKDLDDEWCVIDRRRSLIVIAYCITRSIARILCNEMNNTSTKNK